MRHIFIVNPAAGKQDSTLSVASAIKTAADETKIQYSIFKTEYPGHATKMVRDLCLRYPEEVLRFYACGGDGTLKEVAEGMADFIGMQITHYPCGTGNDFIKMFGKDMARFYDMKQLIGGQVVPMNCIRSKNGVALNIISTGVDARIAAGMQKYKRAFGKNGQLPYLISTLENVLKPVPRQLEIQIDKKRFIGRYTLVLIANGQYYGGGFNPVPNADPSDGVLDVLLIKTVSKLTIARIIDAYKRGEYAQYPQYIEYFQAKKISIYPERGKLMDLNLDGEVSKVSEAEIWVGEHEISFVVPENSSVQIK